MLESVAPAALGPSAQGEVITEVENTVSQNFISNQLNFCFTNICLICFYRKCEDSPLHDPECRILGVSSQLENVLNLVDTQFFIFTDDRRETSIRNVRNRQHDVRQHSCSQSLGPEDRSLSNLEGLHKVRVTFGRENEDRDLHQGKKKFYSSLFFVFFLYQMTSIFPKAPCGF